MQSPAGPKPAFTLPATAAPDPEAELEDQRLDAELDQSFPASDPLPWHHDVHPLPASAADDSTGKKR